MGLLDKKKKYIIKTSNYEYQFDNAESFISKSMVLSKLGIDHKKSVAFI